MKRDLPYPFIPFKIISFPNIRFSDDKSNELYYQTYLFFHLICIPNIVD